MRNWVSALVLLALAIAGCGKAEAPQTKSTAKQELRVTDPAAFVNDGFLDEQFEKRAHLRKRLDSLRALPVIDRMQITSLVNRRKGELISLKKNLRNSTSLTPAQRDSLIAPLESESIELAGDLIAVAQ